MNVGCVPSLGHESKVTGGVGRCGRGATEKEGHFEVVDVEETLENQGSTATQ